MYRIIFLLFLCTASLALKSQSVELKTYRVGIFAPLYLDSAFNEGEYQFGKRFPRFTTAGLDFVNGALIALDSVPFYNGNIAADIYDSKSFTQPIQLLLASGKLDSLHLIIGSVKDSDYIQLA